MRNTFLAASDAEIRSTACGWMSGYLRGASMLTVDLVDSCAAHLQAKYRIGDQLAADLTLQAWAELESERSRAYFDLAKSTPHLVWIIDPVSSQRRAISATDILRLLGPREVARPEVAG